MKEELREEIIRLKKEKNAAILAHNYQLPEVQDVSDFVGDSLELSIKATKLSNKVIVLAGVDFMAEQAAVLNPEKIVLHPEKGATCSLANYLTLKVAKAYKEKYPDIPLVVYVNSYLEVKAISDYIVTSANAVEVVKRIDSPRILFGPDRNLAEYVAEKSGKEVIVVPQESHCYVHSHIISKEDMILAREKYPNAKIAVHPETPKEVRELADFIGSTSQMMKYACSCESNQVIIGTEIGLVHRLRKECPGKEYIPLNDAAICRFMKQITLKSIRDSLRDMKNIVVVDENLAKIAKEKTTKTYELVGIKL
ncbi:MAG: quinolinate synthase NadA [Candidatus Brockarchaeota archaeon]|nr:quinolinate synthase NadA [Candidatus Brockarchaeota archaeon]MBO3800738.1 quinolinate synthase NadA [Candidatus Brockarchaeota archaeon]